MKRIFIPLIALIALPLSAAIAATPPLKITFSTIAGVDNIAALSTSGRVFAGKKSGDKIVISIPAKLVAGTSFFATYQGKQLGPVFALKGKKALLVLNKAPKNSKSGKLLTKVSLKLSAVALNSAYVTTKNAPAGLFNAKYLLTPENTKPLGLNLSGIASVRASKKAPGDSDGDGVMDPLDVDIDGDGVNNIADSQTTVATSVNARAGSGGGDGNGGGNGGGNDREEESSIDSPYTSMYLSLNNTVNWHINGSLSQSQIDATIGGENVFALAFYSSLSSNEAPGVTGGHLVCSEDTTYCKPSGGAAVYSGFSDGNSSLPGQLWSTITTDGFPYSFEQMSSGGDGEGITLAGSFQPRVGTDQFFPGQSYRLDFTNSSGAVVFSKNLTLPLFFSTVPAVKTFGITANAADDVAVNYSDSATAGSSQNPVVLASSGEFAGKLRIRAWRLQRLAVAPEESGSEYRDYGNLNYGVVITNPSGEFTCGGLYSEISSSLTEVSSVGNSGGFSPNDGANLWPLVDSSQDYEPSNESSATDSNTVQFTVDLKSCLARTGLSAGTHQVTLIAAGASFKNGSNRAGQSFAVTIP